MLWPRNESKNHCSISLLNGRETDKTGNDVPESGIESPLLDVDMSKAKDREEQTQTEMTEIIRGLFMTNKNVMKCDDCIKTKHVMFLAKEQAISRIVTLKVIQQLSVKPSLVPLIRSGTRYFSKVFFILKKLQENLQKCTCNSIILYINKKLGR